MLSNPEITYRRGVVDVLAARLGEPRRFMQVVAGWQVFLRSANGGLAEFSSSGQLTGY
jgi:hypothetical protein